MWYVIQTITGREQELVEAIDRVLKGRDYGKCFVIYQECVWRIEGGYKTYIKPMFPSYVFAETGDPERFFFALKQVPKFSRLLGSDGTFWPVKEEERKLLCGMTAGEHGCSRHYLLRRSTVWVNDMGEITAADGFLGQHLDKIVKKRLRKRSVTIEIPFLGEMRRLQIGIRMEGEEPEESCLKRIETGVSTEKG